MQSKIQKTDETGKRLLEPYLVDAISTQRQKAELTKRWLLIQVKNLKLLTKSELCRDSSF
jgi:hypothetical protein